MRTQMRMIRIIIITSIRISDRLKNMLWLHCNNPQVYPQAVNNSRSLTNKQQTRTAPT